ncbi:Mut7-C RNAse domain-containing protein [Nitrosomonas sp.]|uniref:Mut7-C RNAse domain-containing protein n=1 Tax=Nitrosomonas sp. TaxID=42353 RepID=UPI001DCA08ED|nr:Mut7-C RNAse domain-containing protein [Nitrosomonas sp.]MBX3617546.1 Mut7-C ubiquitin/RNAse domain-containing protein [Nitrosomonas sp.]
MAQIKIHFHQSLNDFIDPALRDKEISHCFFRSASIKDMIESFNVPHTEVERILVNGHAVNFDYLVQDSDHIQVYPTLETNSPASQLRLRAEIPCPLLFVVDTNLGRLARYLRLLGFDCLYRNDYEDNTIAEISHDQQRMLLTRDRALLQRKIITFGYFVRADIPKIQIHEVLKRFDLYSMVMPLTRCVHCNGHLEKIAKQQIEHRLQPLTKKYHDEFLVCRNCKQIYWQGSHHSRIETLINELTNPNTMYRKI